MRNPISKSFLLPVAGILLAGLVSCSDKQAPNAASGIWHAKVKNHSGMEASFTIEVEATGNFGKSKVTIINGEDRLVSTEATFDGTTLRAKYDFYDAALTATLDGDKLNGTFVRQYQKEKLTRELTASRTPDQTPKAGPDLTGDWILKVGEAPNQRLWRAAFRTTGGKATGTIIPVSGDWGTMTGALSADNILTLSRFDGINSRVLKVTAQADGTLTGIVDLGLKDPTRKVIGERITDKNTELVAGLPDPNTYTRMSNASEPFRFSFPDADGKIVSSTDERFKGKVVVIAIGGTWCPACHEEAPFLQELYVKYRSQGLEVVSLNLEYTGDAARDSKQVKIFAERYGVTYPMLLAGSTDDAAKNLPQLVNFSAYPTSMYIGRDGLVKRIHAGFEGKATGDRFTQMKAEIEALVKDLLADKRE